MTNSKNSFIIKATNLYAEVVITMTSIHMMRVGEELQVNTANNFYAYLDAVSPSPPTYWPKHTNRIYQTRLTFILIKQCVQKLLYQFWLIIRLRTSTLHISDTIPLNSKADNKLINSSINWSLFENILQKRADLKLKLRMVTRGQLSI